MSTALSSEVPVFAELDPLDPGQAADPHVLLAKARRDHPVFFMSRYGWYVVTRLDDITRIANDPETFSNRMFVTVPDVPERFRDRLPNGFPMKVQLAAADPPAHGRLKRYMQAALSPRIIAAHADRIRQIAHDLVDAMLLSPERQANLATAYADRIPMMAIAALLDAPIDDYDRYRLWVDASLELITTNPSPERLEILAETLLDFDSFIRKLIHDRRDHPGEDAISKMLAAGGPDDALSEEEVLGLVSSMLLGGTDTTGTAIGNMVWSLLTHRSQWEAVRADRGLLAMAFEESVRFRDPGRGPIRLVTRDTQIGGISIPKGALVQLCTMAADHDETVFDRADAFDIFRKDLKISPAWGRGIHMCVGRILAHLEGEIALDTLLDRIPDLQLVGDGGRVYSPQLMMPTLRSLHVRW
ncbi:Cytochrome [Novosphingobium lubricantis]